MEPHVLVALAITAASGTAFAFNEWTHGGMSEAMGWGHRHMLEDPAWHCGAQPRHENAARHAHGAGDCPAHAEAGP